MSVEQMTDQLKGNIWRYQLFSALSFTPIMLPVIVLFWQDNGLDLFDVFFLQGLFAMSVVILEVPTGMVADRLGKRTSLIMATGGLLAGMITYALGSSFSVFFLAEIILALGISLLSGADSALLYDTLKKLDRADEYQQLEGRAKSIQMASVAVSNLLGGVIGSYSFRAAMWASAIGPLIALFIVFGFVEANPCRRPKDSFKSMGRSYWELLSQALKFTRKHQFVRWQIQFLAVLIGTSTWLLWLYQPYMEFSGLPVWAFGIAFAIFNFFAAFTSHLAYKFSGKLGRTRTILGLMILQLAPLPLMALFIHPMSFLFILGHQAVRGISRPVISDWILKYTYADKRATVLSIGSMMGRLFFALTSPLVGFVANRTTLPQSILFQMGFLTVLGGVLLILYRRIPEKYFTVKSGVSEKQ